MLQAVKLRALVMAGLAVSAVGCHDWAALSSGDGATPGDAGFAPSYALPTDGQAVTLGTNVATDVKPDLFSADLWGQALFRGGSGVYVSDASPGGAYVIAGSGGAGLPPNVDAVLFDFTDATWRRLPNANGVGPRTADFAQADTTGGPFYELTAAAGATVLGIPAPAHLSFLATALPAGPFGGARGSFVRMGGPNSCREGAQGLGVHRFDLATATWSRVGDGTLKFDTDYQGSAVFVPGQNRVYFITDVTHRNQSLQYLDVASSTVRDTVNYPLLPTWDEDVNTVFYDPVRNALLAARPGHPVRALPLNDVASGWLALNMTGTLPSVTNRWAYYEPDGRFYSRGNKDGQTLLRLTPPASQWQTAAWVLDTVKVGGATLPDFTALGDNRHYGNLFYVPPLRSLAWVSGHTTPVVLLKPPVQ